MNAYRSYMDRITLTPTQHERLMAALEKPPARIPLARYGTLAACCALALLAVWGAPRTPHSPAINLSAPVPGVMESHGPGRPSSEPPDEPPAAPGLAFTDRTMEPSMDLSIAFPAGSFEEPLTRAECLALLGTGESPAWAAEPPGVSGKAAYDGTGALWRAWVWGAPGQDGEPAFTMTLAPGGLPVDCVVYEGGTDNVVEGVSVHADKWVYDRDGDGADETVCRAAFLSGDAGLRVEAVGAGAETEALVSEIVRAVLTGEGVTLSALSPAEIPEWRSEKLTLAQARGEPELGTHIPGSEPAGFSFADAFRELGQGRDWLSVRWERGYDYVSVLVFRPFQEMTVTDVSQSERYDVNRYETPYADTVPEAYRETFDSPVFRWEDMTLEVLSARMKYVEHDSGDSAGFRGRFTVLFADGLAVEYSIKGLTVEQAASLLGLQ